MKTDRIVLAGGNGFLGTHLAPQLVARGFQVIVLTRRPASRSDGIKEVHWDGRRLGPWAEYLNDARAVINLAGRTVNCRYTPGNRKEIIESRVDSVKAVAEAIRGCARPPSVFVQCGSLALYGNAGERWCDEGSPPGADFPAETCLLWEKAFEDSPTPETRRVLLRIGFVLGKGGGALEMMARLARWGLGGTVGNGRQYISWVHCADMNRIFEVAIDRTDLEGVFNVSTPNPVTNARFMRELRRALRRPWSPPVPVWAVRLGCWLMETEPCLALTGRRCAPRRLVEHGFNFKLPELSEALGHLYGA